MSWSLEGSMLVLSFPAFPVLPHSLRQGPTALKPSKPLLAHDGSSSQKDKNLHQFTRNINTSVPQLPAPHEAGGWEWSGPSQDPGLITDIWAFSPCSILICHCPDTSFSVTETSKNRVSPAVLGKRASST